MCDAQQFIYNEQSKPKKVKSFPFFTGLGQKSEYFEQSSPVCFFYVDVSITVNVSPLEKISFNLDKKKSTFSHFVNIYIFTKMEEIQNSVKNN